METMHCRQEKIYNQSSSKPVGMIKFNDNVEELKQGTFYLKNVVHFVDNGGEMIQDPSEGVIELSDGKISSSEIIKNYSENMSAYICCFTVLFDSDFDNKGQIKESTVEKILRRGQNNPEKRDAIIFSCNEEQNIMKVFDNMYHNTPEFKNVDLKKPNFEELEDFKTGTIETTQIFNTNNITEWKQSICGLNLPNEKCQKAFNSLNTPRIKDDFVYSFFGKEGWLGNDKVKVGFKGSYVYYGNLTTSEKKRINRLFSCIENSVESSEIMKYEELLQYCFLQKDSSYKSQNEYRILVTHFSSEAKLPDSIKLVYNNAEFADAKLRARVIKNNKVPELNLNDLSLQK